MLISLPMYFHFLVTDSQIIDSANESINLTPSVNRIGIENESRALELHKDIVYWFFGRYGTRLKDLDPDPLSTFCIS